MKIIKNKLFQKIIVNLILVAIIIWFIFFVKGHWSEFQIIKTISVSDIIILLILNFVALIFEGMILKIILQPFKINLKSMEWFGLNVLSSFGNVVFPFGGWGVRGVYLKKKHNFDYASFLSVLAVITIIGLTYWWAKTGSIDQWLWIIFSLVTVGGLAFILLPIKLQIKPSGFFNRLSEILKSWEWLKEQKLVLIKIILLMIGYFVVNATIFYWAFRVFGFSIPWLANFIPNCLSNYTLIIRLLPASIGVYEGAVVYSARLFSLDVAQALVVAEVVRLTYLFWLFVLTPVFSYILIKKTK